jgi:hypothetical protein
MTKKQISFLVVLTTLIVLNANLLASNAFAQSTPATPPKPTLRDGLLAAPPSLIDLSNGKKIQIGGFVYTGYAKATSGSRTLFPEGSGTTNGYNGDGIIGFNNSSFRIRESRLFGKMLLSPKTFFMAEIAPSGSVNTSAAGATPIQTRRLYGQHTFGDGTPSNLSVSVGQFWNPFGFATSNPLPFWYTPERPLLGKESARGLFDGQEFDRGVKFEVTPKKSKGQDTYSLSVINGTGLASNDTNRGRDVVLRYTKKPKSPVFTYGASVYRGTILTNAGTTTAPVLKASAQKNLYGLDAQYHGKTGMFAQLEYVAGTYEAVPPIALGDPKAATPVLPSAYVKGNKIEGYSAIFGKTFKSTSAHPYSIIGLYDVLNRGKSLAGQTDGNVGLGASYNLDAGTRARLFYTNPFAVSKAISPSSTKKVGLLTLDFIFAF